MRQQQICKTGVMRNCCPSPQVVLLMLFTPHPSGFVWMELMFLESDSPFLMCSSDFYNPCEYSP